MLNVLLFNLQHFIEPSIPVSYKKVILVGEFLLVAILILTGARYLARNRYYEMRNVCGAPVLKDLGHDILCPHRKLCTVIFNSCYPILSSSIFFRLLQPDRLQLGIHFITLLSMLFITRSVLMVVTTLPDPSGKCKGNIVPWKFDGGCSDLMFSGHTAAFTAVALQCLPVRYALSLSTVNGLCIIGQKRHYTIDVIIAVMFAFFFNFILNTL